VERKTCLELLCAIVRPGGPSSGRGGILAFVQHGDVCLTKARRLGRHGLCTEAVITVDGEREYIIGGNGGKAVYLHFPSSE
jgi:hypothetical protein